MVETFGLKKEALHASRIFEIIFFLARIFILVFLMLLPFAKGSAQTQPNAHELLEKMTLEEKVAQLSQLPGFPIPEFREQVGAPEDVIRKSGAGSVLWVSDPKEINRLQHIAIEKSRLHIPILFGLDVIHGYHTIFPGSDRRWLRPGIRQLWKQRRPSPPEEARAAGIQWTFAPMVDIARDARWGRMVEGAGEDPYLGAAMARAQVRGFQGPIAGAPEQRAGLRQSITPDTAPPTAAATMTPLHPRRADAERLPPAIQSRRQGRSRQLHERLHGPQQRPRDAETVSAARCAAQHLELSTASWSAMQTPSAA